MYLNKKAEAQDDNTSMYTVFVSGDIEIYVYIFIIDCHKYIVRYVAREKICLKGYVLYTLDIIHINYWIFTIRGIHVQ